LEHVLEAFLYKLMGSTNKIKVVDVIELHWKECVYNIHA
jgi:hypothetical protein